MKVPYAPALRRRPTTPGPGDVLLVWTFKRLSHSLKDLIEMFRCLNHLWRRAIRPGQGLRHDLKPQKRAEENSADRHFEF